MLAKGRIAVGLCCNKHIS